MPAQITALPTPPSTNDPANFNTRADAFLGQMPTFVTEANAVAVEVAANAAQAEADRAQTGFDRVAAASSAASALNAPGTNGSSATSLTLGAGTKAFTTQPGKAWAPGQGFFLASTASPVNWMSGILTAYNSVTGAATVEVDATGGAGTFSAWNCGLAAGRPYALASQADALGGVDNTRVMTPLRTLQAVRAQQAPNSITSAINLTSLSAAFQVANMPSRGVPVTLPDATTLQLGHNFKILNIGSYDLPIKDPTGAIKTFVRPGRTAVCTLSANATATGVWLFEGGSIYGCTVDAGLPLTGGGAPGNLFRVIALDASRDFITFMTGAPYSLRCVVYDRINNVFGPVATIQSSSLVCQVAPVNASTALAVYAVGDAMVAVTISISGLTPTINAPVTYAGFASSIDNIFDNFQVGSANIFRLWSNALNGEMVFAVTVSGVAPSIGPAAGAWGGGNNSYDASSCFSSFAISSSSFIIFSLYNSGSNICCRLFNVSGASVTLAAAEFIAQDSGQTPYKVELLSTGRYLVLSTQGGVAYATLVAVSGGTTSQTTRLSLGAMASSAGYGFNGPASGVLVALPAGRALCSWINTVTGVSNWVILTDTSGTLSVSAVVTRSAEFQASGAVAKIGVAGNVVYLARTTASNFGEFYAVDCANAAPSLMDVQRFSSGIDPHFGLLSYSPQNKFRSLPMMSNVLQGGGGVFGLAPSNGSSSPVQSTWVFNPYPRQLMFDSADGYTSGYGVCSGSSYSDFWAGIVTSRMLHIRRVECIV